MAFLASLRKDRPSCRLRRAVLLRLGFDIAPGALIYCHVLLLGRIQLGVAPLSPTTPASVAHQPASASAAT